MQKSKEENGQSAKANKQYLRLETRSFRFFSRIRLSSSRKEKIMPVYNKQRYLHLLIMLTINASI